MRSAFPSSAAGAARSNAAGLALLVAVTPDAYAAATQADGNTGSSFSTSLPDVNLSWSGYFEALAILCFVLAVLWGVLWLLKKRGGAHFFGSSTPGMQIESRLALGPKKWLLVVRYLERRMVIGLTDRAISLLTVIPDEPDQPETPPVTFLKDIPPRKKHPGAFSSPAKAAKADPPPEPPPLNMKKAEVERAAADRFPMDFADLLNDKKNGSSL